MSLLARPHHDGSALHVSDQSPGLGDAVTVFLRVPDAADVSRVLLRTTPDGEGEYTDAVVDRRVRGETWWRAEYRQHNPDMGYRFLLDGGRYGYRWLHQGGLVEHDPPDATDFRSTVHGPPPAWAADSTFYQIFPDRFARAGELTDLPGWAQPAAWGDPVRRGGDAAMHQLYGGNLDGIRSRLDHLSDLGVDGVWLTPFFPAESNHRYNASTFDHVDPVLGGDEALRRLTSALHDRGMRLLGDLTPNHSGDTHEWFRRAQADATSAEARFYFFLRHPEEYLTWLGVPTLPKFDHRDPELRRRLWDGPDSVVARWLRGPSAIDGWRIDVANMTGRQGDVELNEEVARGLRRTLETANPDALLIGEHGFDPSDVLAGDGWHGVMSYSGFGRPAWCWLRDPAPLTDPLTGEEIEFLGMPVPVPRQGGATVAATMDAFRARIPWRSAVHNFNQLGSHDTARFRTAAGSRDRHLAGVGLLLTMPGIPVIFAGDEVGLTGWDPEDARQPFPWERERWDATTHAAYRALIDVRRRHDSLRRGGLRWVERADDVLVFLRETAQERLLVAISRAEHEPVRLEAALLGADILEPVYATDPIRAADGIVVLPGEGPATRVWALQAGVGA
jgi:alpha-glucosidase